MIKQGFVLTSIQILYLFNKMFLRNILNIVYSFYDMEILGNCFINKLLPTLIIFCTMFISKIHMGSIITIKIYLLKDIIISRTDFDMIEQ